MIYEIIMNEPWGLTLILVLAVLSLIYITATAFMALSYIRPGLTPKWCKKWLIRKIFEKEIGAFVEMNKNIKHSDVYWVLYFFLTKPEVGYFNERIGKDELQVIQKRCQDRARTYSHMYNFPEEEIWEAVTEYVNKEAQELVRLY